MNIQLLQKAANEARGLAIDAVHHTSSGHLGLPLGCAELGAVLFAHDMQFNPKDPRWLNRDRFILSAGHGSMFIYTWLHMSGFDVTLDDLKGFRSLRSRTPGHPEFGDTPGVECTTGPLGQGVGNAVGFAVSQKMAAARFNTSEHTLFDSHVICLAGDGCMQEGVASEASAFAGHFGLDNLILVYDANDVTLDAMAEATQSEDTGKRYEAYGFEVTKLQDGHDMEAIAAALKLARENDNGKPNLIILKTEVGRGIPEVAGTAKAHGEGGAKYAEEARKGLGLPEEKFYISDEVMAYFREQVEARNSAYEQWQETYKAWQAANPELAAILTGASERPAAETLLEKIPEFEAGAKDATRGQGGTALNALADALPLLISGSADLHGSTKNYLKDKGDFTRADYAGRNFRFGIREHGMGAILNGLAYDGIFIPSGATFLTFSDYMRPSIRLAALAKLPALFYFTHDSVGVGEDGPTHQPVETVSALRCIPNLDVIRPADGEESAAACAAAISRAEGPTALIMSRQKIPAMDVADAQTRRKGTLQGAYVLVKESAELETILIATGSEVQHAVEAAKELGAGTRVVSMPSMERFNRQDAAYQESVLPSGCEKRIAIEAGVSGLWYRYVGERGAILGIDRFGLSAPGNEVMRALGMTAKAIIDAARNL